MINSKSSFSAYILIEMLISCILFLILLNFFCLEMSYLNKKKITVKCLKTYNNTCSALNYISSRVLGIKYHQNTNTLFKGNENYIYFSAFVYGKSSYLLKNKRIFYFYFDQNRIVESCIKTSLLNPIHLSSYNILCRNILKVSFLYFNKKNMYWTCEWNYKKNIPDVVYLKLVFNISKTITNQQYFFLTKMKTYL